MIKLKKTHFSRNREGFLYILPAVLVLGFVSLYPLLYSIGMSFFNWNWGARMDFVGLNNYIYWLTSDKFWNALGNTIKFTVGAVFLEVTLGLLMAVLINKISVGLGFVRTLLMVPLMVSGIVVSLMWKILLDPTLGIVNYAIQLLGLKPSPFFGGVTTAMPSIIMVDVWWQTAYIFIILTAGIKSLPVEPFEAAKVDGASSLQAFWYLTIPMVKPVLLVAVTFRTIDCLKVFAIVYGTTGGGPGQVTEVIQSLAYRTAFSFLEMSRGMTLMVIFSAIIMAVITIYLRLSNKDELSA
jgi:multiple sugar transport system permease protein